MIGIKDIFTYQNLNKAFYQCFSANSKKHKNRVYYNGVLLNNLDLMHKLLDGKYKPSDTQKFQINERGKVRDISAPVMRDRIVQKIICQEIFVKQLVPKFIYDNYSSVNGRGTSMARKRFQNKLYGFLREIDYDYEHRGYVLQVDIRKFFNNIDHTILKSMLDKDLHVEDDLRKLIYSLIDNSSETGIGLDIGSQIPQLLAMYYLSKMDNYMKCVKGIKNYCRYADDIIIIAQGKEELREYLADIKEQLDKLHLEVNQKKTHIVPIKHGFTFLQTKYRIIREHGRYHLLKSPTRPKIVRFRKRMKSRKKELLKGKMEYREIYYWYHSERESLLADYNCIDKTIKSLDKLFNELFEGYELPPKQKRSDLFKKFCLDPNIFLEDCQ